MADLRGGGDGRLALGESRLVHGVGGPADGVAEALLEVVGAPPRGEATGGPGLLARPAVGVEALRPRRPGLAEAHGAVERDRREEGADGAVHEALLGEAGA